MSVYAPPRNSRCIGQTSTDETDAFIVAFEAAVQAFNNTLHTSTMGIPERIVAIQKVRLYSRNMLKLLKRRAITSQS